jgi:hypothetical protein
MNIHHYDAETKRYLGSSVADLDPAISAAIAEREVRVFQAHQNAICRRDTPELLIPFPDAQNPLDIPDDLVPTFLHPANTTTVAPPNADTVAPGMFPCFDEEAGAWRITPMATAFGQAEPAVDPMSEEGMRLAREAVLKKITDELLNAKAKSTGFESMADAITYADDNTVAEYQRLGASLRSWRALVKAAVVQRFAEFTAGTTPPPADTAAWIAMLPEFTLLDVNPELTPQRVEVPVVLGVAPQQVLETVDAAHPDLPVITPSASPQPAPRPSVLVKAVAAS